MDGKSKKSLFILIILAICVSLYLYFKKSIKLNTIKEIQISKSIVKGELPNQIPSNKSFDDDFELKIIEMKKHQCKAFYGSFYKGQDTGNEGDSLLNMITALGYHPNGTQDLYLLKNEYERYKKKDSRFNIVLFLLNQLEGEFNVKNNLNKTYYLDFGIYSMLDKMSECFGHDKDFISRLRKSNQRKLFEQYSILLVDSAYDIIEAQVNEIDTSSSKGWSKLFLSLKIIMNRAVLIQSLTNPELNLKMLDFESNKLTSLLDTVEGTYDLLRNSGSIDAANALKFEHEVKRCHSELEKAQKKYGFLLVD